MRFSAEGVGVPRLDGALDRGQPERAVDEKKLDDLGEQSRVSPEPFEDRVAFKGRKRKGGRNVFLFDHRAQQTGIERFAHIAIHPGTQTAIAVARHCVCRHRDDAQMSTACLFARTDLGRRLEAVHDRHLNVHQHNVEGAVCNRRDRRLAVADDRDIVSPFAQQPARNTLVDDVVFGDEHPH